MNDLKTCPKCGWGMTLIEAGVSKAGKPYPAFYSCRESEGGCGYTENLDGTPVSKKSFSKNSKKTPKREDEIKEMFNVKQNNIKEMFDSKQQGILASVALQWAVEWAKGHEKATTEIILKIADEFYKWLKNKADAPF